MRQLKSTDLFAGLRVVKAIGVKEEMKEFAQALANGAVTAKTQREMGVELMLGILANCGDKAAEKAFYEFLSAPMEISVEELQEMDLIKFAEAIKDLVEYIDMEAWKAFFTSLAGPNEEDAVIDRLATRYGWTVPEILDLDAVYLYRMDRKAKEGKNRDDAYQAWLVQLPFMIRKETKYVSFSDYWDRVSGKNLDLRPDAEILAEVAAIREELKGL